MPAGFIAAGCSFPVPNASDGEAGWVLPVLNSATFGHVAGNKDKVTTADDYFDRVVRNMWRRHILGLACNGENAEDTGISVLAEVVRRGDF